MPARSKVLSLAALALAACPLMTSCAALRAANARPEYSQTERLRPVQGRKTISSYRTWDGRSHVWHGTVEPLGADSLLFLMAPESEHGLVAARPGARLALAREDVRSLSGRRIGTGVGLMALFGLGIVGYTVATFSW